MELHFTVPRQTTDGNRVRSATLLGTLCRSESNGPCLPFAGGPHLQSYPIADSKGGPERVSLRDDLLPGLRSGPPRPLIYRLEFFNPAHRSAGLSDPVFAAAGSAPPEVEDLRAEGSRRGILLRWKPDPTAAKAEVLLRREVLGPPLQPSRGGPRPPKKGAPAKPPQPVAEPPGTVWLQTHAGGSGPIASQSSTLDDSAVPGQTYSYVAQRRLHLQLAGHAIEMQSELSAPAVLRLGDTFPPPAPTGLTAAGFNVDGHYAIDLIWEPVNDPGVVGYIVTRTAVDAAGAAIGSPTTLTAPPVDTPALHDATPVSSQRYRYEVVAVDAKGIRSVPVAATVESLSTP